MLDNIMYVVCAESSTIRLYNTDTCSPLDAVIHVEGMMNPVDIVVCRDDRQLYVADSDSCTDCSCIWRVSCDDHSYDTRCYFNVRSKADISQLNLPHGTDN